MNVEINHGLLSAPPLWIKWQGTNLAIDTTSQHILGVVAAGDQHIMFIEPISNQVLAAWTNIDDPALSYWLFWELDSATGQRRYISTTIQPTYSTSAPTAPVDGQLWFDILHNTFKKWVDGLGWVKTIALQAGTVKPGLLLEQQQLGSQLLNPKPVTAGFLIYDKFLNAIKSKGKFITTDDPLMTDLSTIAGVKLDNTIMFGKAGENIAKYTMVKLLENGQVVTAVPGDVDDHIVAVSTNDAVIGEAVNLAFDGIVTNPEWDFGTNRTNSTVYVGDDGQITIDNSLFTQPRVIGRVYNQNSIMLDFNLTQGNITINQGSGNIGHATTTSYGVVKLAQPTNLDALVVSDDDPRLSDARTPKPHTHPATDVIASNGTNIEAFVNAAIHDEMQARVATDTQISDRLTMEGQQRQQRDDELAQSIANEATTRHQTDVALQSNIDQEAQTRLLGDRTLQSALDQEAQVRGDADVELHEQIETRLPKSGGEITGNLNMVKPGYAATVDTDVVIKRDLTKALSEIVIPTPGESKVYHVDAIRTGNHVEYYEYVPPKHDGDVISNQYDTLEVVKLDVDTSKYTKSAVTDIVGSLVERFVIKHNVSTAYSTTIVDVWNVIGQPYQIAAVVTQYMKPYGVPGQGISATSIYVPYITKTVDAHGNYSYVDMGNSSTDPYIWQPYYAHPLDGADMLSNNTRVYVINDKKYHLNDAYYAAALSQYDVQPGIVEQQQPRGCTLSNVDAVSELWGTMYGSHYDINSPLLYTLNDITLDSLSFNDAYGADVLCAQLSQADKIDNTKFEIWANPAYNMGVWTTSGIQLTPLFTGTGQPTKMLPASTLFDRNVVWQGGAYGAEWYQGSNVTISAQHNMTFEFTWTQWELDPSDMANLPTERLLCAFGSYVDPAFKLIWNASSNIGTVSWGANTWSIPSMLENVVPRYGHMVAIQITSGKLEVFIDGNKRFSTSVIGTIVADPYVYYIGGISNVSDTHWNGLAVGEVILTAKAKYEQYHTRLEEYVWTDTTTTILYPHQYSSTTSITSQNDTTIINSTNTRGIVGTYVAVWDAIEGRYKIKTQSITPLPVGYDIQVDRKWFGRPLSEVFAAAAPISVRDSFNSPVNVIGLLKDSKWEGWSMYATGTTTTSSHEKDPYSYGNGTVRTTINSGIITTRQLQMLYYPLNSYSAIGGIMGAAGLYDSRIEYAGSEHTWGNKAEKYGWYGVTKQWVQIPQTLQLQSHIAPADFDRVACGRGIFQGMFKVDYNSNAVIASAVLPSVARFALDDTNAGRGSILVGPSMLNVEQHDWMDDNSIPIDKVRVSYSLANFGEYIIHENDGFERKLWAWYKIKNVSYTNAYDTSILNRMAQHQVLLPFYPSGTDGRISTALLNLGPVASGDDLKLAFNLYMDFGSPMGDFNIVDDKEYTVALINSQGGGELFLARRYKVDGVVTISVKINGIDVHTQQCVGESRVGWKRFEINLPSGSINMQYGLPPIVSTGEQMFGFGDFVVTGTVHHDQLANITHPYYEQDTRPAGWFAVTATLPRTNMYIGNSYQSRTVTVGLGYVDANGTYLVDCDQLWRDYNSLTTPFMIDEFWNRTDLVPLTWILQQVFAETSNESRPLIHATTIQNYSGLVGVDLDPVVVKDARDRVLHVLEQLHKNADFVFTPGTRVDVVWMGGHLRNLTGFGISLKHYNAPVLLSDDNDAGYNGYRGVTLDQIPPVVSSPVIPAIAKSTTPPDSGTES